MTSANAHDVNVVDSASTLPASAKLAKRRIGRWQDCPAASVFFGSKCDHKYYPQAYRVACIHQSNGTVFKVPDSCDKDEICIDGKRLPGTLPRSPRTPTPVAYCVSKSSYREVTVDHWNRMQVTYEVNRRTEYNSDNRSVQAVVTLGGNGALARSGHLEIKAQTNDAMFHTDMWRTVCCLRFSAFPDSDSINLLIKVCRWSAAPPAAPTAPPSP